MSIHHSEQELQRRQKLVDLRALGIDPYPAEEFKVNVTALDIKENYDRDKLNYKDISIAVEYFSRALKQLDKTGWLQGVA